MDPELPIEAVFSGSPRTVRVIVSILLVIACLALGSASFQLSQPLLALVPVAIAAYGAWLLISSWRGPGAAVHFVIEEAGIRSGEEFRRFDEIVSAREAPASMGFFSRRAVALWLEFSDGSMLGIGPWLAHFKELQAVVAARLPAGVAVQPFGEA